MKIEVELLVGPKGTDLTVTTAWLTLTGPMNHGKELIGLSRLDLYRFSMETSSDPGETAIQLEAVLNRQSTFFNRNKHFHSLECHWGGGSHTEGYSASEVRSRWESRLANSLRDNMDRDLGGKDSFEPPILGASRVYLVEVMVEDDDISARDALAAKLQQALRDKPGFGATTIACQTKATLWWLALIAQDTEAAKEIAEKITVTKRRDEGLLSNPNYQHAQIISIDEITDEITKVSI